VHGVERKDGMEDTITTTLGHGNGLGVHRRVSATGNTAVVLVEARQGVDISEWRSLLVGRRHHIPPFFLPWVVF
jgi:hypothetical protein